MAELLLPNVAGNFQQGQAFGTQQRQVREGEQRRNTLAGLAQQAYSAPQDQQQGILAQAVGVDPEAGMALDKGLQASKGARVKQLAQRVKLLVGMAEAGNEEGAMSMYAPITQEATAVFGMPFPTAYNASILPALKKFAALSDSNDNKMFSQKILANGNIANTMADGTVVDTGIQADRQAWFRDQPGAPPVIVNKDGSLVTPGAPAPVAQPNTTAGQGDSATVVNIEGIAPERQQQIANVASTMRAAQIPEDQIAAWISQNLSQPQTVGTPPAAGAPSQMPAPAAQPGLPSRPLMNPAQEQAMELSRQANARAEQAAQLATRGNAPAGFRFKADGSLEPIPGGPKPAGAAATEGERKAATLLARLTGSLGQLEQAVKEDPSASSPNLFASSVGSVFGDTAANALTPANRQRVEAAQLDILDAALTLGTGAAYTREQLEGYRRSYFPQIGDSQATISDKADRLNNVIEAAKIAAGRAGPQVGVVAAPAGPQPGTVQDGYRFRGGNPADPNSWERL